MEEKVPTEHLKSVDEKAKEDIEGEEREWLKTGELLLEQLKKNFELELKLNDEEKRKFARFIRQEQDIAVENECYDCPHNVEDDFDEPPHNEGMD